MIRFYMNRIARVNPPCKILCQCDIIDSLTSLQRLSGHNLVTECKRTFDKLTNKEALLAFGGQLSGYQVSSVTFSALLILDLYDRAGSAENIRDRVSVETVAPHGERNYSFAIFRVQGHRKSPSAQKLKAIAPLLQPLKNSNIHTIRK
jgi:hypothetical protein